MTIIESYTLRTPVIGAAIGGIVEIIEEGKTGYKFKSSDTDDLRKVIGLAEGLSKEEYIQMKDNAETFGKENFGKENYYTKLMELYRHTINNYQKK